MKVHLLLLTIFAIPCSLRAANRLTNPRLSTPGFPVATRLFSRCRITRAPSSNGATSPATGGGARTAIAEDNGLQFEVDVNQYYLGIWDGGRDESWDYNGSSDYRIKFDSSKSGLWEGGFLEIHGETYWGRSVNQITGAVIPVNTDPALSLPAGNGTYLPHVTYTQFLAENFAVFLGKLDTTVGDANRFAHGVGDQRFMNLGFSFNPVSLQTTPYSPLGAGFLFIPMDGGHAEFYDVRQRRHH